MSCNSAIPKAALALMAGAVLFAAGIVAVHAQDFQVLGASPPAQESAPELSTAKRLVLHDIQLRGPNAVIDSASAPVLDYAVNLLRRDPSTIVYISGEGDRATVQRQAAAVAQYLRQHGIGSDRLVLEGAQTRTSRTASKDLSNVVVLNLTTPQCNTCSS